jgi:hypothetical protein
MSRKVYPDAVNIFFKYVLCCFSRFISLDVHSQQTQTNYRPTSQFAYIAGYTANIRKLLPSSTWLSVSTLEINSHLSVPCQFRISAVSVPYQYRPFSAPVMCEWFYLRHMWQCFCVGHRKDSTDTELTRYWYVTDKRESTLHLLMYPPVRSQDKWQTVFPTWTCAKFIDLRSVYILKQ